MSGTRLAILYRKHQNRSLSPEEREEFFLLMGEPANAEQVRQLLDEEWEGFQPHTLPFTDEELNVILYNVVNRPVERHIHRVHLLKTSWFRVAAAILIAIVIGTWFWNTRQNSPVIVQYAKPDLLKSEVTPGGNKAILTLGDGSSIVLDSAANGKLATDGAAVISKTTNGEIVYSNSADAVSSKENPISYNTIHTPPGGQYQLTLSDGSKAWLNAASSIVFPTSFTEKERRVEISGEVYFEVAKNNASPFVVKCKNQTVKVLGTHFNIRTYGDDEVVQTSLLEGSVEVALADNDSVLQGKSNKPVILHPGQQASIYKSINSITVKEADMEEAIAWKNGYFIFSDENIKDVMKNISRWYNVDVEYAADVSDITFGGSISRSKGISETLKILELTKMISFKIEGRKIIVNR